MPKQALESLTESMFYLLMALTQGERCGTEITAFAAEITAGRVKIGPATLYTLLVLSDHPRRQSRLYSRVYPAAALPAKRGRGGAGRFCPRCPARKGA